MSKAPAAGRAPKRSAREPASTSTALPRPFFDRAATAVAPELLGCVIEHESDDGVVAVRLTEVEAYLGLDDPGSHAFRGVTPRTRVMFGPPGYAYVYFSYGMHWCLNLVCAPEGTASAVLLRAGEVVAGQALARRRRGGARDRDLARGPARLTRALGVDGSHDGLDVLGSASLRALAATTGRGEVVAGPRTGVGGAGATQLWRFHLAGEPTVSPYRAHARRMPGAR